MINNVNPSVAKNHLLKSLNTTCHTNQYSRKVPKVFFTNEKLKTLDTSVINIPMSPPSLILSIVKRNIHPRAVSKKNFLKII